MMTCEFTLHLDREITEDEADALYGAFADGSIATGENGTAVDFTREASSWASPGGERFWHWRDVARWARERMNLAVDLVPDEIRKVDEVLKARQAMAEAQQILRDSDDATRRSLGQLLDYA